MFVKLDPYIYRRIVFQGLQKSGKQVRGNPQQILTVPINIAIFTCVRLFLSRGKACLHPAGEQSQGSPRYGMHTSANRYKPKKQRFFKSLWGKESSAYTQLRQATSTLPGHFIWTTLIQGPHKSSGISTASSPIPQVLCFSCYTAQLSNLTS